MRILIACGGCRRQFDVTGMDVGQGFHCTCGVAVRVPAVQPHQAAVTRCSSCGAARSADEATCRFCLSGFELHERALDTICAGCATRCPSASKFCHSCGVALTADVGTGAATELDCPVCDGAPPLYSRPFDQELTLLECHACTGLWLSHDAFEEAQRRSRDRSKPFQPEAFRSKLRSEGQGEQAGPMYRKCPVCQKMMLRRNHGRTSGVIIDLCVDHGVWFDADELPRILKWIEKGGETHAKRFQAAETKRNAEVRNSVSLPPGAYAEPFSTEVTLGTAIADLVLGVLFRR